MEKKKVPLTQKQGKRVEGLIWQTLFAVEMDLGHAMICCNTCRAELLASADSCRFPSFPESPRLLARR